MSADLPSLLALLQLTDSGFPSGAFTHSYGLEQLVREGLVKGPADVERFVSSILSQSVAQLEAPAALEAAQSAADGDLKGVLEVDRRLLAIKATEELRNASLQTGRRMLEEVAAHVESPLLAGYRDAVSADASLGNYAAVFGAVSAAIGVGPGQVLGALMLASATALLQAAMRLTRVSHRDVQGMLHRLRPRIVALAGEVGSGPLCSFHPLQDIASMRHARAEARLFAS